MHRPKDDDDCHMQNGFDMNGASDAMPFALKPISSKPKLLNSVVFFFLSQKIVRISWNFNKIFTFSIHLDYSCASNEHIVGG